MWPGGKCYAVIQSGDIDTALAEWVIQTDASLNWIFFDRGFCMMSNARCFGRVQMVESGGIDSAFPSAAPVLKREPDDAE